MATWAYPPLPPAQIEQEADSALVTPPLLHTRPSLVVLLE